MENSYYSAENIPSNYDWHHQHNLDLLSTSYQYIGQMKTAEQLMTQAFAIASIDESHEFAKKEWPRFLLGRGRKQEALAAANALANGKYPAGRAMGHLIAGQVFLSTSKMQEARDELAAAQNELRDAAGRGSRTASSVEPELEALRAEITLREGRTEEGRVLFKEVERRLRALLGPDAWSQALFRLESIAQAAREAGDWELAEYTAKQMLEHDTAYAGSHYAMALVAEHKGERSVAQQEFAKAEARRHGATPT